MKIPPIEKYKLLDKEIHVVRDDLSWPFPHCNNAKMRGIEKHIEILHEQGVKVICNQDTRISRIGWGMSVICKEYDIKFYDFYPTGPKGVVPFYQKMVEYNGGIPVSIRGTRASAMKALAGKWLKANNISNYYYMPIGAALDTSVTELANLVGQLPSDLFQGSLVTCVSSGTITAGLTYGCHVHGLKPQIYGIQSSGFVGRQKKILDKIQDVTKDKIEFPNLHLVDEGWDYDEASNYPVPYPCDKYLDTKVWDFIEGKLDKLPEPITMFNVGGEWDPLKGLSTGLRGDGIATRADVYNIKQRISR